MTNLNLWEYGSRGAHTFHQVRDEEPITERYNVSTGQKYHCQPVTWVRLSLKKNVRNQWQIILYFSNLLGCAGTGRCSRLCQVPTAIPVNAQINYCLCLFFSVVTHPVSKTFIKNRSCASQSRGANSDLKTGEVGFTFQSRHFIWGFWLSPHKSCFVYWHWDVLVPLNQYINSYFRKKQILIEKSWESVGAFSSLISQRSCPTEPDFLLIESSKPVIHLP